MPRIPTSLLRKAYAIDPLLPRLLPPCRDLRAAQNELRWLREHVDRIAKARCAKGDVVSKSAFLRDLVRQRAFGKPLQYLLGTEFFGDLEISCRPGVLIPRQDTAASIQRLVRLIRNAEKLPSELRVLDLCTGTGCIPLLFHHELHTTRDNTDLHALGIDLSNRALQLAVHNLKRVRKDKSWVDKGSIGYMKADVLASPFADLVRDRLPVTTALRFAKLPNLWDIVISNPPYISPSGYWKTTTRSVRGFEPKLALVPPPKAGHNDAQQGDAFYQPILDIAREVDARIVLLEVADLDQALRVARAARALHLFDGIEVWRELPDAPSVDASSTVEEFSVLGQGNARSVVCWRDAGITWLGKSSHSSTYNDVPFPDYSTAAQFVNYDFDSVVDKHRSRIIKLRRQGWSVRDLMHEYMPLGKGRRTLIYEAIQSDQSLEQPLTPNVGMVSDRPLAAIDEQSLIVRCRQDGWTMPEIWITFKCDRKTVLDALSSNHQNDLADRPPIPWGRRMSKQERVRALQYYENGWTYQAISEELGYPKSNIESFIYYHRKKNASFQSRLTSLSVEKEERLIQHYRDGWKIQDICDDVLCSIYTVRKTIDRARMRGEVIERGSNNGRG